MRKNLLSLGFIGILFLSNSLTAQAQVSKRILHDNGTPSLISFASGNNLSSLTAQNIFEQYLNISSNTTMKLASTKVDNVGKFKTEKYQMYFDGIPVEYAIYNLHYKNGALTAMNGEIFKTDAVQSQTTISAEQAFIKAKKYVNASSYMWEDASYTEISGYKKPVGEKVLLPILVSEGNYKLISAYKFDIYAAAPISRGWVYIDANDGKVLAYDAIMKHAKMNNFPTKDVTTPEPISLKESFKPDALFVAGTAATRYSGERSIDTSLLTSGTNSGKYALIDSSRGGGVITKNAKKSQTVSATLDFIDNDNNWTAAEFDNSTFDNAALDAHWGVAKTYDYFKDTFNRNSYDDNGTALRSYIHYGSNYENAGWTGAEMVYGDGASTFKPLTAFDVTAHELGHGVCQETANLAYQRESGALNEGFSDIWGAIIEHKYAPEKQAFLIGEDIVKVSPNYLRSMITPKTGLNKQPDTYRGTHWYPATVEEGCASPNPQTNDNCGVHYNSGVLNHWFYILVMGKVGTNDLGNSYDVTGIGWEKAEKLVYKLESEYVTANSNYKNTRDFAIEVAKVLYGENSQEMIAVQNAFFAVGVGAKYLSTPDTTPPTVPTNLTASNIKGTSAKLTWGASTDDNAMEGYIIYKDGTEIGRTTSAVTYDVKNLTRLTTYDFTVKALDAYGNISDASNIAKVTTTDAPDYCASQGNTTTDEKINRVQFNTIDKTSTGTAGYEDFTDVSTTLEVGKTYEIKITPKWGSTPYNEGYAVFIDWNNDGDFNDPNEKAFTSAPSSTTPIVGNITVPSTAVLDKPTRMRVSLKWNGIPTACETFSYGQVEDYTVTVVPNLAVSDINKNSAFSIFPNPVKDVLNIQTTRSGEISYQVINTAGQAVLSGKTKGQNIQVQSLPVGNYIIQMTNGEETSTQKFIKK
ncbi:Por secretion system C-terminal sorting domain-containing protein [Soonwooa buanensis]|uniref:Por secretion system C-terminal sorting domain-containing protein n=1 Tax=Soonwooa buanensis TaxID=619805 RepID=A0A1T5GNW6_9FLAO|nr:M4 family metallopeptidase [Soonwooa buanensis]SKC10115.1 Por secretion system C-terminal sorting domain-containing protein [Soonwooa buanensis]